MLSNPTGVDFHATATAGAGAPPDFVADLFSSPTPNSLLAHRRKLATQFSAHSYAALFPDLYLQEEQPQQQQQQQQWSSSIGAADLPSPPPDSYPEISSSRMNHHRSVFRGGNNGVGGTDFFTFRGPPPVLRKPSNYFPLSPPDSRPTLDSQQSSSSSSPHLPTGSPARIHRNQNIPQENLNLFPVSSTAPLSSTTSAAQQKDQEVCLDFTDCCHCRATGAPCASVCGVCTHIRCDRCSTYRVHAPTAVLHLYPNVIGDGEKDYDSGLGEDIDFDAIVNERALQEDDGDLDGEYENIEDGDFEDMVNIWAEMGGCASTEGKEKGNTFYATNGSSPENTTETKTTTTLTRRREDDDAAGTADHGGCSGGMRKKARQA